MRESTTYQAILREGRIEGSVAGAQQMLLRQGTKRFGPPEAATVGAIEAIGDLESLECLGEQVLETDLRSWHDLLRRSQPGAVPSPGLRPRVTGIFRIMRQSTLYQRILEEGRIEGRIAAQQRMIVRQGTKRFGPPDAASGGAIQAIRAIHGLESLGERMLEAGICDWGDLLGGYRSETVPVTRRESMTRIVLNSRVGSDGILQLTIPIGKAEADREVQITIDPLGPPPMTREEWRHFIQPTVVSITDASSMRREKDEYERREEV